MEEVAALLNQEKEAVLSTLEGEQPFASAVGYCYEKPASGAKLGTLVILMSELARHTKNIRKHSRVSVMVIESGEAAIYEKKRVAAQGVIEEVRDKAKSDFYKQEYLERYPSTQIFFTLSDFHFFEMKIEELYYVGGFGKIQTFK